MQEVSCLISFMHFSTGSAWLVSGCAFCLAHSVLMQSVCDRAETGGYEGWLETAIRGAVSPEKLDGLSFLFTVSSADSHTVGIITYQPGNTHTRAHRYIFSCVWWDETICLEIFWFLRPKLTFWLYVSHQPMSSVHLRLDGGSTQDTEQISQ